MGNKKESEILKNQKVLETKLTESPVMLEVLNMSVAYQKSRLSWKATYSFALQ